MSDYYCKDCKGAAVVVDGEVRRSCSHSDSTIIAERTSTLYGDGGVSPGPRTINDLVAAVWSRLLGR
jgi:hypothetical protein